MTELRGQSYTAWKKSTASGGSGCIELAQVNEAILIRDSKNPTGSVLNFTRLEWISFLAATRTGAFDT